MIEEENSCDLDTTDISPDHSDTKPINDELDPSPLLRLLPALFQKGADPSVALSNYCKDLQWRIKLLQTALAHLQTSGLPTTQHPDHTADLSTCKEDIIAVIGRLSKVSDIWTRRETGPVLPI